MNNKVIAVAVAAVVIAAGAGCYFAFFNGDDADIDIVSSGNYMKILGNSNGDHLLNDKDVQIILDCVNGKIAESDLIKVKEKDNGQSFCLADADGDGKITLKDADVLKGIIDRSGKEMKLIDTFGHLVTVPLKVDRIACDYFATAELLQMVGAQDKIVCATNALMVLKDYYLQGADTSKVVNYYSRTAPDFEKVQEADPDIWVVSEDYINKYKGNTTAAVIGLDTLVFDFKNVEASSPIMSALLAGQIFNNVEKSLEYVEWYLSTWKMLDDVSSKLTDDERPDVFYTGYGGYIADQSTKKLRIFLDNTVCWQAVELAGGHNVIDDYPGEIAPSSRPTSNVDLDLEWISEQKYDFLFAHCTKYTGSGTVSATTPDHGYTCDDPSEYKTGQSGLGNLTVLKNSCDPAKMYLTPGDYMNGASGGLLSAILVATVIHPDLYKGLDLAEEHQKYVDLMGFDFDVNNGVFFVPNG